jgi:hypothetical protein
VTTFCTYPEPTPINLTGDYVWSPAKDPSENHDGLKPLRAAPDAIGKAA